MLLEPTEPERDVDAVAELARDDLAGVLGEGRGWHEERRAVTVYGSYMVEDRVPPPAPAHVPGQVPGASVVTSDPYAVQTPAELQQSRTLRAAAYPATIGMRDDTGEAAPPVPGTAPPAVGQPQDPAVAAYQVPLPEGFTADPAQLDGLKALAVESKLAPEVAGKLVGLHAQALAARQAQLDADIAGWAEKSRQLPEWSDPQRPAALDAVKAVLPPAARTFLESTAFGSHPAVVEMTLALGKELLRLKGVPAGSGPYGATPGMRP